MKRMRNTVCVLLTVVCLQTVESADPPPVQQYLTEGHLQDGADAMQALLGADPDNQQAQFSLGVVQFLQAVEGLGQDHFRYGLLNGRRPAIMFLRLPVPPNPQPEQISAEDARSIVQNVLDRLEVAEQTLAKVTSSDVSLPLPLAQISLDLNGDGKASEEESLGYVIRQIWNPPRRDPPLKQPETIIGFDAADAVWLRGYCRALSAAGEMILAYNWEDQFQRTAHLLYPNMETPFDYLGEEGTGPFFGFGGQNVLDIVAFIHMINYEVIEPERMQKAIEHLQAVIDLSRQSWKLIQAETDDNNEWLPGPNQSAVITDLRVGRELVTTWHAFLDEMEAILQGKKLIPFWRGIASGGIDISEFPWHPTLGVNVRRVFTEPGQFDLALWLQGTGMQPWLEEGDIVDPVKWNKMLTGFQDHFWPVFFWFN